MLAPTTIFTVISAACGNNWIKLKQMKKFGNTIIMILITLTSLGQSDLLSEKVYDKNSLDDNAAKVIRARVKMNAQTDGYILKPLTKCRALDLSNSLLPFFPLGYKNLESLEYLNLSNTNIQYVYRQLKKLSRKNLKTVVLINTAVREKEIKKIKRKLNIKLITNPKDLPDVFVYETQIDQPIDKNNKKSSSASDTTAHIAENSKTEKELPPLPEGVEGADRKCCGPTGKLEYTTCCEGYREGEMKIVTDLHLRHSKDVKAFLENISQFKNLERLFLMSDEAVSLPPQIGELKKLKVLNIQNLNLKTVPSTIKNVKQLEVIWLPPLQVYPKELNQLPVLEEIYLAGLKHQTIPEAVLSISGLKKLKVGKGINDIIIDTYQFNNLNGIGRLTELEKLEILDVASCDQFLIPAEIQQLKKLKKLKIVGLPLHTQSKTIIAPELGQLNQLKHLDLTLMSVQKFPHSLSQLKNLEYLAVVQYGTGQNTFPGVEQMPGLKTLKIRIQQMPDFSKLMNLETLHISLDEKHGIPKSIYQLNKLKQLSIQYANGNEGVGEDIGNLRNLEELRINYSNIQSLPSSLSKLTELKRLYLEGNKFTAVPKVLFSFKPGLWVKLEDNPLTKQQVTELKNHGHLIWGFGYKGQP